MVILELVITVLAGLLTVIVLLKPTVTVLAGPFRPGVKFGTTPGVLAKSCTGAAATVAGGGALDGGAGAGAVPVDRPLATNTDELHPIMEEVRAPLPTTRGAAAADCGGAAAGVPTVVFNASGTEAAAAVCEALDSEELRAVADI